MPSLLPPNLLNPQNNPNPKINLIPSNLPTLEVSTEEDKKFEITFIGLGVFLGIILGILTYANIQKSEELKLKFEEFNNRLGFYISESQNKDYYLSRISKLEEYKKTNSEKNRISDFFNFTANLYSFLANEEVVSYKYTQTGNNFDYEIIVNTTKENLDQETINFLKNYNSNKSFQQNYKEIVEGTNLIQYKFSGTYESK